MSAPRWEVVAIAVGTLMFGAAIACRHSVNPWWSNAAAAVVAIAFSSVVLRARLRELFRIDLRSLFLAVGAGAAMVAITHLGFRVGVHVFPGLEGSVTDLYGDIRASNPGAMTVPLIIAIVLAEEILWRGVAVELCCRRFSPLTAAIAVIGLYATPQLIGGAPILIAAALAVGGVFTLLRFSTGRVTEPVITHAIWSVSIFSLIPLD